MRVLKDVQKEAREVLFHEMPVVRFGDYRWPPSSEPSELLEKIIRIVFENEPIH